MIESMRAEFGVEFAAKQLGVSVSGYYAWRRRPVSDRDAVRWDLAAKITGLFVASGRSAGHRKIHQLLIAQGVRVNRKTVAKRMRELGLMPLATIRAWKRAAARKRAIPDPPDLVGRDFSTAIAPGAVLVGDITYVPTQQGWLYVATVIDLSTRTVIGLATGKRQQTSLITRAMKMAIRSGVVAAGAIFHSDHGRQYASKTFQRFCRKHRIRQSMGANYECWDNAVAETFFSKLKSERLDWIDFRTRAAATREVFDYVDYFNTRRPHQTIGYSTPHALLQRRTQPAATAQIAA